MIRFRCNCGKHIAADDKHSGKIARCPNCGETIKVPEATRPGVEVKPTDTNADRGRISSVKDVHIKGHQENEIDILEQEKQKDRNSKIVQAALFLDQILDDIKQKKFMKKRVLITAAVLLAIIVGSVVIYLVSGSKKERVIPVRVVGLGGKEQKNEKRPISVKLRKSVDVGGIRFTPIQVYYSTLTWEEKISFLRDETRKCKEEVIILKFKVENISKGQIIEPLRPVSGFAFSSDVGYTSIEDNFGNKMKQHKGRIKSQNFGELRPGENFDSFVACERPKIDYASSFKWEIVLRVTNQYDDKKTICVEFDKAQIGKFGY
jgi:DNA-directed RNA polymerase subunit RPC12/RpoP